MSNKGYITVEACIIIPLFLFFMIGMIRIFMTLFAEAHIHQALASATDYAAHHSYLERKLLSERDDGDEHKNMQVTNNVEQLVDTVMIRTQFHTYLGEDFYVGKVVIGGSNGILINVEKDVSNEKIMLVTANYQVKANLPLLGTYSIPLSSQIKQKAFVGFSKEEYSKIDHYVYVTPNREAYHIRRDCTHLKLAIRSVNASLKDRYTPCYYCGNEKSGASVYVGKENSVYHNSRECIGLKRTVRRVLLSAVRGLGACERCGG